MRAVAVAVLLSLAGCTGAGAGPEGDWRVVELDGTAIAPADGVTLALADGQATGRSGCNRFTGGYALGSGFTFGPLAATRMACFGRAAELETLFNRVTGQVDGWRREDAALVLMAGARPVLRAVPAESR
ncbi:MAG: META domain-containing protein [Rhodobacter sp.]|uniref:META domain-containing protein n=1 Tax=Pararhodobacter sp. TaxID=2127056 RepID=UPI001DEF358E|nr:META domain-containing protein [Pararhodobacter sp.]MCB1345490.1 META domain-containing protein [Paracoccaceae bacterium]MCC0073402.1 META domain-containing protein [Rhodobacter sp.]HPD92863.1 META domain-containing protein [Pararhodobacter sp.]